MATKTKVSIEKINAWMNPTNSSKNRNGSGTKYGIKKPTIISSTSPANTFPKRRKENEIILMNSEINSSMPTNEKIGFFMVKNFEKCFFAPRASAPKRFTPKTDMVAKARVKLRSAAGERKRGIKCSPSPTPMEPTTGKSPNQFETTINIKTVAINGKYLSEVSLEPKTESIKLSNFSSKNSIKSCTLPGASIFFLLEKNANETKISITTVD